ncbi:hypothetical protein TDB9533_01985 [Thalassocella blandensis]|nr:hypothetical protein TDB9533_01985 [Thalassocella blandensis]
MATEDEKNILRAQLEKYEGKVVHMYLDSKGYVTVGVGHLLTSIAEAQKLPFINAALTNASATEIKADFEEVKKQPKNRLASFYKKSTKLSLSDSEINKLTDSHIDNFEEELSLIYSDFLTYPKDVRLALFDLIFNLGMTNLKTKWPNFNAAIQARDWKKAAENSNRKAPVSAERNRYVKDLLEKAASLEL